MKDLIEEKTKESLTGFIKFTFVNSVLSAVTESNSVDVEISRPCSNLIMTKLINFSKSKKFYGTIIFEFENGIIKGYAYSRKIFTNSERGV